MVQLQKDDKVKSVGYVKVNLAEFIEQLVKEGERKSMTLEKCKDKNAQIFFKIKATLISESLSGAETMS